MLEASGMNTRNAADPPEGFKTTELGPTKITATASSDGVYK